MMGTLEGHVESIREEEATPVNNLDNEAEGETAAPPRIWVEQLKGQHREIEEAWLPLEQECAELDREPFHCPWPIWHEHGWNTSRPTESKVGRT